MATNIINAHVQLRYDTYTRWMNSSIILLAGEVAIATMPNRYTIGLSDIQPDNTPPAIGIKVGDGTRYFRELPWVQAIAADVYDWAKSSTKPTYNATEIEDLETFIQQHGSGGSGTGGSTSSAYRIVYDSANTKYILESYDAENDEWITTGSEINLSSIIGRILTIENWANGATTNLGNIETPLAEQISDAIISVTDRLNVTDAAVAHQFVTSVSEYHGRISVSRASVTADDIVGVLTTENGGTGFSSVNADEILVGSDDGNLVKTGISTFISEEENSNNIPTTGAVMSYIENATAGLTGAMHFIGEATVNINSGSSVNPRIPGYIFRLAAPGDVILYDAKEFVWTGSEWRLLGDEGSYAVKGSIVNVDIADEANIAISKIAHLQELLDEKVDKVEGKQLSTNDYTTEEKQKLASIEEAARANIIEHIFLNDEEIQPTLIQGLAKSINLAFLTLTQAQIDKLDGIEPNAQVNTIEHIYLNGTEVTPTVINERSNSIALEINGLSAEAQAKLDSIETGAQINKIDKIIYDGVEATPDVNKIVTITSNPHTEHENKIEQIFINGVEQLPNKNKQIDITLDQAALNLNVIEGAQIPNGASPEEVTQINKKLQLERIAVSGNVEDLKQTTDTYIILNCGSSTTVI